MDKNHVVHLVRLPWLLEPNETITEAQLERFSRKHKEKQDKIISLHENGRENVVLSVKRYLETLNYKVVLSYSPGMARYNHNLFRSMTYRLTEQHFTLHEDTKNEIDS